MSGFDEFTEAVMRVTASGGGDAPPQLDRVAVLGGGSDARLIAAMCLAEGASVTLFSAYGAELESIRASGGISLRGAGPVGTYQVDRERSPSILTTAEIDRAVDGADVIFLTGPIHKYRTYAMVLADHLKDGQIVVLLEGRSLGALETSWLLRTGGCKADITIVEIQGLPYWIKTEGSVLTLSDAGPVPAAALPSGRKEVARAVSQIIPNLTIADSVLDTGFSDGSALVEFPALLFAGSGAAKLPMGAEPISENHTFASLIEAKHKSIIARLAAERRAVASAFGVRNLPNDDEWISSYAGAIRGEGARPVPPASETEKIFRDGIIGSFAPLVSAAALTGISVPATEAMITLGTTILGADVATAGRKLGTIGIDASEVDTARKVMDAIAMEVF